MNKYVLFTRQRLCRFCRSFLAEALLFSVLLCFILLLSSCTDKGQPDTSGGEDKAPQTASDSTEDSEFEKDDVLTFENYSTIETYYGANGSISYRFHEPLREHDEPLPLIVYLHGLGEALSTKSEMLLSGAGVLVHSLYSLENEDAQYAHYALIPITPTPEEGHWSSGQLEDFTSLMLEIIEDYDIDPCRVYITGWSMGGYTSCELLNSMPPDTFAAVVPICGAFDMADPESLYDTAFRIYHSADDDVVDVSVSRSLYAQLTEAGHPNVEYIENEFGGHGGPVKTAFDDEEFFEWLFAQRLPQRETE